MLPELVAAVTANASTASVVAIAQSHTTTTILGSSKKALLGKLSTSPKGSKPLIKNTINAVYLTA